MKKKIIIIGVLVIGIAIYVLDLRNIMLNIFQVSENYFMNSFEVESTPLRITKVNDALVVASLGGEGLFEVYNKRCRQESQSLQNEPVNMIYGTARQQRTRF